MADPYKPQPDLEQAEDEQPLGPEMGSADDAEFEHDEDERDDRGRFTHGNTAHLKRDKAVVARKAEERKRAMILRSQILDIMNDPNATIPLKDFDGEKRRVPIARAVAMHMIYSAMKGNGTAMRSLMEVAGEPDAESQTSDVVIIRVPRGGYNDQQGDPQ